ncbi:dihydroorotate dehydrogenase [Cryobacterium mesophilum]|uniref:Dihydroorotate dehydrogenase (quinone) n=1 Tax=Terrimesophilobacter mesophilus TaxID=433647 RepID=A0A4R8V7Y3_9MICO|nr:quinone-dependent dihydroorotate dehydrogenase [Terrimesophilobacter mesophilus]MBB5632031.1 dihydroorotate dehydrogenase [Terrimesophilobacter mesophilus]TFB78919.1 quinone-dependent dihydroorotate dehydrogenase [Terrimesophilobacter mesophilus]
MYRLLFRLVLARLDPERAHGLAFFVIRILGLPGIGAIARSMTRPHPTLAVSALGLEFASPFGMAAGFDKDATGIRGLGNLGFGHVEVGTLTARAQEGNPRPRLFRLIADRALINRMGFNNYGAADAVVRLRRQAGRRGPVVGVNIGKSRVAGVDDAVEDYLESTRLLAPVADYLAVNVSSPNTPGLRRLQESERLRPLLTAVRDAAGGTPVLVKIAPDLDDDGVAAVCALVTELGLSGIIATNTTLSRAGLATAPDAVSAAGDGGLSGVPLAPRSLDVLRRIRAIVPEEMCVISVGGVETAEDVAERLEAGATLVQGYTGFVYRGPFWVRSINRGLAGIARRGTARA